MIGRLFGKFVAQDEDGSLVVDVNGVGYDLIAPLGTNGRIQKDALGRDTYFVHTHVREDAMVLFGFATERERAVFRMLISVSNIGPKTAIGVLSALTPDELAHAVNGEEVARLTAVSGVGKKTAERIVLELRGKLFAEESAGPGPMRPKMNSSVVRSEKAEQLFTALTGMGYKAAEAERAVSAMRDRTENEAMPALVKDALQMLAR